jgi:parallel beta-helix repeat protein
MHKMRRLARTAAIVGASAATLAALTAGQASAQNVSCGDTITKNTKLTGNLVDCPDDGIIIGAPGITLDLNGYMIDGDEDQAGNGNGVGVGVNNGAGYDRVVVKRGSVRQFIEGVSLENANKGRVTGLWLSENQSGIELADSDQNSIDNNTAVGNEEGIGLGEAGGDGSDKNVINANLALNNGGEGIALESGSDTNRVSASQAYNNEWGILVDSQGSVSNRLELNTANMNRQDGLYVGEATTLVKQNIANHNLDYGIDAFFGAIDGGANRAVGNGNPAQCLNVVCF